MTHDNGDKISNKDRSPSPMHASSTEAQQESNETAVQNTKKKGVSYSVPQQIDEKAARQQQQQQDRSRFFAAEFATREPYNSSREQFLRDSMVTIEIQANIEKTDAYPSQCLSDLSFAFSTIFQRPESSITVIMNLGCAIKFGMYVDDPSYLIVVSALPGIFGPVTNKRLTYLIQSQMDEAFKIPPARGLIRFQKIKFENLATNGATAREEFEHCKKNGSGYHSSQDRVIKSNERSSDEHSLAASVKQSLSRTKKMRRSNPTNTTSTSGGVITSLRDQGHIRPSSIEGQSRQQSELSTLERPRGTMDGRERHGQTGEMTQNSTPLSGEEDMTELSGPTASNLGIVKEERGEAESRDSPKEVPKKKKSWTRFFTWPGRKASNNKRNG